MPLPYFEQPKLTLGPLTIHAFGALITVAVAVGARIVERRAAHEQLDASKANRLVFWILVPGFIVAHVFDRLVYYPREWLEDPISILWIWKSLSSFGGFIGVVLGAWMFSRRFMAKREIWRYLDLIAYGFVFGWIFGRLGCALAFDHPGRETSFFLAQHYMDGKARFNLGMIEAAYFVPLSAIFFKLSRAPRPAGFFVGLLCVLYGPFRFVLDFARHIDVRYLGLTPAQWGSLLATWVGFIIFHLARSGRLTAAETSSPMHHSATMTTSST